LFDVHDDDLILRIIVWKEISPGEGAGKVAVVQLCLEASRCDVMHIKHSGIPPSLLSILQDSTILKVGGSHHSLFSSKENFTFNTIPTKSNQFAMYNLSMLQILNEVRRFASDNLKT